MSIKPILFSAPMIRATALAIAMLVFPQTVEATNIPTRAKDALSLVTSAARKHGVPIWFAVAVAMQESGGRCYRKNGRPIVGAAGEVGPLQIKPATSRYIGLPVTRKSSCAAQVNAGMKHLAMCLRGSGGDKWRAATCHNAGLGSLNWKRPPKSAQRYANEVLGRKSKSAKATTRKAVVTPAADAQMRYVTNFGGVQ
jgi:hypothetical protein